MKKRVNLLIRILILAISVLFTNCQNEQIEPSTNLHEHETTGLNFQTLNFEQLYADQSFSEPMRKFQKYFGLNSEDITNKNSSKDDKYTLSISTNEVTKITTEDAISWTFKLNENVLETSDFENLLVKEFNGVFSYFLVSYTTDEHEENHEHDEPIETSTIYKINEDYLNIDEINAHLRLNDFTHAPIIDGDGGCDGVEREEIKPCSSGGRHRQTYACQHSGGIHGTGYFPPCGSVCSGTEIIVVYDFSHCGDGTGYTPSGPTNTGLGEDTSSGSNGGGITTSSGGGSTLTTPITNSDGSIVYQPTEDSEGINDILNNTLSLQQLIWLSENKIKASQINAFLGDNPTDEDKEFAKYAIEILIVNPNANVLLAADCRSFEYAQPPGALQKGCAVKNFDHRFYTFGVRSNGSPYYGEIDINTHVAYFTMPSWMTNGRAANLTAAAVTAAIKAADIYFFKNPDVTKFRLAEVFNNTLKAELAAVGGSFSTTIEPFPILSPAPYLTSVMGISNPFNCE